MTRSLRLLLGSVAAVALLALGGGLALAHGGHSATKPAPAQTPGGDDAAESSTGAGHEQEPADSDSSSGDSSSEAGAAGNHGAIVSKVARETPPGPNHGKIVSAVARANHGAAQHAAKGSSHSHGS
ncbi:MAG: hypothetical protein QOF08_1651 [Gaiellales bacterium]|jgi:hypothetical protein|nr:hypothetical protein [Gaiellales bacterium]